MELGQVHGRMTMLGTIVAQVSDIIGKANGLGRLNCLVVVARNGVGAIF